jgi:hypothetical protein
MTRRDAKKMSKDIGFGNRTNGRRISDEDEQGCSSLRVLVVDSSFEEIMRNLPNSSLNRDMHRTERIEQHTTTSLNCLPWKMRMLMCLLFCSLSLMTIRGVHANEDQEDNRGEYLQNFVCLSLNRNSGLCTVEVERNVCIIYKGKVV